METNRQTSDILSAIAERARRYTINLDGQIERDPSASTRGGYGMIYRGTLLAGGRAVAVKTARGIPDIETAKRMLKEAHTWSKLEHSNILNILGITTTFDHTVSLVSPWMDGGSAYRYVQKPDRDPRPLVKDIALGLCYLHSHPDGPIIHGDLKGDNVLITSDGRAVLTDFGLSVLENSSFSMTVSREAGGSLRWMAPEMVDALSSQDPGFTVEGDIWAFGMTTLELFTRKHPYFNLTSLNAIQSRILKGPPEQPSSEDTSSRMTDEWWGVCSRCLKMAPSSRIGAVDVVKETRELPPRNDIVIVVIGPTGSGKSNFVNKLTGCEGELGADNTISPTQGIREFVLDVSRDKRYVFVDTPGFDNVSQPDQDVLQAIGEWLRNKYLPHVRITGVIYTHRITDRHMSDTVRENLTEFCRLCGEMAPQQVRLVTTWWDNAENAETASNWVSQLEGNLWKPSTAANARHERFSNTQKSALDVVNRLVGKDALLTSEELERAQKQLNKISVTDFPNPCPRKNTKMSLGKRIGSWFRRGVRSGNGD